MSLKPVKKSDSAKSWMRSSREKNIKMQLGHHLIVTEGTKTEPNYFKGLKKALEKNIRNDRLHIEGQGTHTIELIECAKLLVRRSGIPFKHVWIVYDKDDFPEDEFNRVVMICKDETTEETEYHAIWSNQCVEIWYLLHFGLYQTDIHRIEYFSKITRNLKKINAGTYAKNRDDMFDVLRPYLDTAILNAEKLDAINAHKSPSLSVPGTKMHDLMKYFKPYL